MQVTIEGLTRKQGKIEIPVWMQVVFHVNGDHKLCQLSTQVRYSLSGLKLLRKKID